MWSLSPGYSSLQDSMARVAPFLDDDYRKERADLLLYRKLARRCDGPILDVGCGTGRVMADLLARGHGCDGIDLSPALLKRASVKCRVAAAEVPWSVHEADMRGFELPRTDYSLALLASNTLMHAPTPGEQSDVLTCVGRHLRPGGLLALDLFQPPVEELVREQGVTVAADSWQGSERGIRVTKWMRRSVDWVSQVQHTSITYEILHTDGRLEQVAAEFPLRFLWRNEAELMLKCAGFDVEAVWGSHAGEVLDSSSERMIFLAVKPGR